MNKKLIWSDVNWFLRFYEASALCPNRSEIPSDRIKAWLSKIAAKSLDSRTLLPPPISRQTYRNTHWYFISTLANNVVFPTPFSQCWTVVYVDSGVRIRLHPIGPSVCEREMERARAISSCHIYTFYSAYRHCLAYSSTVCVYISTYLFTDENCWYHLYLCLERQLHKAYRMYVLLFYLYMRRDQTLHKDILCESW